MKNIRFLILLFTTTLFFIGCGSDDKKNDVINNIVDDEFPVKRELDLSISGSLHTREYSVLDRINPELTPGVIVLANPYENDLIRLSFKDSNQNLSFALSIPKEVGTFQYNNDTSQKITLYVNKDTDDEIIFVSKNLTLNVTEFTPLIQSTNSGASKLYGSFSGTVVKFNSNTSEEEHTIEGNFIFNYI